MSTFVLHLREFSSPLDVVRQMALLVDNIQRLRWCSLHANVDPISKPLQRIKSNCYNL